MLDTAKVLIADDDPTSLLLMGAALRAAGFQVAEAGDGGEALRLFQEFAPDVLLLDVAMPVLDGFQVLQALRGEQASDVPIIMVTGLDDEASIAQAYDCGATDFIAKPVNWSLIGHHVRYVLRSYRTLQQLHEAESRNTALLDALPDTLISFDLSGRVHDFRHGGAHFGELANYSGGDRLEDFFRPDLVQALLLAGHQAAADGGLRHLEFQGDVGQESAGCFEARLVLRGPDQTLCLIRDISARKQAEQEIHRLAFIDTLTGLPNRQSFLACLEREVERAARENGRLAVLFLDLDGFKGINDALGHGVGDLALQWLAQRLRKVTRPYDAVARAETGPEAPEPARLGGDEFTFVLPGLDGPEDALVVARRILETLRRPMLIENRPFVLTASIGIALYPEDGEDAQTLLKHADTAMYHAKDRGRNTFQFYQAALTDRVNQRLRLDGDLRQALERGEFLLHFQPQYDLGRRAVTSVEALLRWRRGERLVPPLEFLPLAEENGLIQPIGDWVLRTACQAMHGWRAAGLGLERVAVNLSPMQLREPDFVQRVFAILAETGLPAECLELEITEGTLMEDSAYLSQGLRALRQAGVHLALDDFGTGYSSMSYLPRLPLAHLKIDRTFIQALPDSEESLAIVKAVLAMARGLGLRVTAEGVETAAQLECLQALGCDQAQGYFLARPTAGKELAGILGDSRSLGA